MATTRDTLLFAALMGTEDCPLAQLQERATNLRDGGDAQGAARIGALIQRYTAADAALRAQADSFTPDGARQAMAQHRTILARIAEALAAPVPAEA